MANYMQILTIKSNVLGVFAAAADPPPPPSMFENVTGIVWKELSDQFGCVMRTDESLLGGISAGHEKVCSLPPDRCGERLLSCCCCCWLLHSSSPTKTRKLWRTIRKIIIIARKSFRAISEMIHQTELRNYCWWLQTIWAVSHHQISCAFLLWLWPRFEEISPGNVNF
jgi:hypothetical protein